MVRTEPKSSSIFQAMGWKSVAIIEFLKGPSFYNSARDAFKKASDVIVNAESFSSIGLAVGIYQSWSSFERSDGDTLTALQLLIKAKTLALQVPCLAGRSTIQNPIDNSINELFSELKQKNVTVPTQMIDELAKINVKNEC